MPGGRLPGLVTVSVSFYGCDDRGEIIAGRSDDADQLNWANGNAAVVFALLGLDAGGEFGGPIGTAPIWRARRAVMYARATFARRVPALEREPVVLEGQGARVYSCGLDAEGLRMRLEAFSAFVEAVAARGAVAIAWG